MSLFICENCGKSFNKKFNYIRHKNRKNPCKSNNSLENNDIIENKKNYVCAFCLNEFSSKNNLVAHMKECTSGFNTSIFKEKEDFYINQIETMKEQINTLINKTGNTTFQINQKIDQSIHNQNITINSYGNENLNYITDQDIKTLISQPHKCIPKFIEMVHYNENHPENHNIMIENIKENLIKTLHNNNRWSYSVIEKFIEQFTVEKYDQLCDYYDNPEVKTNFDKLVKEKFDIWADEFDFSGSKIRKETEENVKLALISGSKWLKDKFPTKRAMKKVLNGELNIDDLKKMESNINNE